MSFSPNGGEEDPAKQRELRKLWRAWRTVHEMCQDRVRCSSQEQGDWKHQVIEKGIAG